MSHDTARAEGVVVPHEQGIHVARAVTVNRPVRDLYVFWRDPANLTAVVGTIDSIERLDERRARWHLNLPTGMTVDLGVEVINDVPGNVIAWRSLPESQIAFAGAVRFRAAPGNRGSEMHLAIEFVPPGGVIGQAIGSILSGAPKVYVGQILREIKQVMEAGEKPTIDGQPSGRDEKTEVRA